MNYDTLIKEKVIKSFVDANKRKPNKFELIESIAAYNKAYPNLSTVGLSGYEVEKPQFMSLASVKSESKNAGALTSDFLLAGTRLDSLSEELLSTDIGLGSTVRKLQRELNNIESRLDNVLLFTQTDNPFLIGVEENFTSLEKLDFENTTASVESFGLTAGRRSLVAHDLKNAKISFSTSSEKGYQSFYNNSSPDTLKDDDGNIWSHQVYTSYSTGRVSLQINVNLDTELFVSQLRLNFASFNKESGLKATVSYSVDGKVFSTISPAEVSITTHEYVFDLGVTGIKKIRILLSKDYADAQTSVANQFVYYFSLDSLKIYTANYMNGDSLAYLGPYDMYDENSNNYNFTKATCDVCYMASEKDSVATDSVNIFLSKDGSTYLPLRSSNDFVIFGNSVSDASSLQIDNTVAKYQLIDDNECDYQQSVEGILNFYIPSTYVDRAIPKTFSIRRNIVVSSSLDKINSVAPGWTLEDGLYTTTVYVSNPSGVQLDLGPTIAYINSAEVTGKINLPAGYSVFATSVNNWREVDASATTINLLRNKDRLYPYNHKYIIEGYTYPKSFVGERVYVGLDYFAKKLSYIPNDYFNSIDYDPNVFTYEETASGIKFKVKLNKSLNNWESEKFQGEWQLKDITGNSLWVKLLLRAKTNESSPVVSSFKLRVI